MFNISFALLSVFQIPESRACKSSGDPSKADWKKTKQAGRTPLISFVSHMSEIAKTSNKTMGFAIVTPVTYGYLWLPMVTYGYLTTEAPHSCASLESRKEIRL